MRAPAITGEQAPGLERLTDWNTLGAALGVKANIMAWVLKNRRNMQHRIRFGERVVYNSDPALQLVQRRLLLLLEPIMDELPENGCVISYRKGENHIDTIRGLPHARTLVTFDIRGFYDHVTLQHIEDALVQCGMHRLGARLVARYCVVSRRKGPQTLQQGSPASPALSNIVGHFVFDDVILRWLRENGHADRVRYLRYCDNICLVCTDDMPEDFTETFKDFVRTELGKSGFRTHKWHCVRDDSPVQRQQFLGIVVNAVARVDLAVMDRLRAILFNICRKGAKPVAEEFARREGLTLSRYNADSIIAEMLRRSMAAHVMYVGKINDVQGLRLRKLLAAADLLTGRNVLASERDDVLSAVKLYRNREEDFDDYVSRIEGLL